RAPETTKAATNRGLRILRYGSADLRQADYFINLASVAPRSAGDFTVVTPAFSSAANLAAAVPLPPEMIAPAWPMRLPGGADAPAMNATTGLVTCSSMNSAASSSALPPISPTMMMPSVCLSSWNNFRQSMKFMPLIGSPPMPITVDWPRPTLVVWNTASYVNVPERDTIATLPGWWMWPGMMPILHSPGVMMPGQFGPISTVSGQSFSTFLTRSMSSTGMPSVIATITLMPPAAASMIASAANGGGTKITEASAPVSSTASRTVLKTGRPMCSLPPLPGVTPPTSLVP